MPKISKRNRIPDSAEMIGEMAFRRKKALKNVIISSTVKVIEQDAFYDCANVLNGKIRRPPHLSVAAAVVIYGCRLI